MVLPVFLIENILDMVDVLVVDIDGHTPASGRIGGRGRAELNGSVRHSELDKVSI